LWFGPPGNVIGGVVALNLIVGRSDQAAVTIGSVTGYPNGFEFAGAIRCRSVELAHMLQPFWGAKYRLQGASEVPPEVFRAGVEFSDGSKDTTQSPVPTVEEDEAAPKGPVLLPGGGGGAGLWKQSYWVWPLPPEGLVAFVCEWPAAGIALSLVEIDAATIRRASEQSQVLWEPGGVAQETAVVWAVTGRDRGR
jgi:hypothetical protein